MEIIQDTKLSPERRNEILDLLIKKLHFSQGICETLGLSIRRELLQREHEEIHDEFFIHFHQRDLDGLTYIRSDTTRSGFIKSFRGMYYFESYEDCIEFLKSLKTANVIRTRN